MSAKSNSKQIAISSFEASHSLSGNVGASIYAAVNAIVAMLDQGNLVKVDPAKLREVLNECNGTLSVGTCCASGKNRAEDATESALAQVFPSVDGCEKNLRSAIINICGSADMTMHEYNVIVKKVVEILPDDASILMGVNAVNTLQDSIQVTVLLGGVKQSDFF